MSYFPHSGPHDGFYQSSNPESRLATNIRPSSLDNPQSGSEYRSQNDSQYCPQHNARAPSAHWTTQTLTDQGTSSRDIVSNQPSRAPQLSEWSTHSQHPATPSVHQITTAGSFRGAHSSPVTSSSAFRGPSTSQRASPHHPLGSHQGF